MRTPKFWGNKSTGLNTLLMPFGWLYQWLFHLRLHMHTPYHSKIPLLIVGNIQIGGGGKTPFCIWLVNHIQNKNICFLSKGYGGTHKTHPNKPLQVYPHMNACIAGDEPLLLAQYAPTVVCHNRLAGIQFIERHMPHCQLIISDDGLQNPYLLGDISVLSWHKNNAYNEKLFPAGPWRESLKSVQKRIDWAVVQGNGKTLEAYIPVNRIIQAQWQVLNTHPQTVIAFSGIANPENFFTTLVQLGYTVVQTHSFPDHHVYTEQELHTLYVQTTHPLITTEKDYVRLSAKWKERILCLKGKLHVTEYTEFIQAIHSLMNR